MRLNAPRGHLSSRRGTRAAVGPPEGQQRISTLGARPRASLLATFAIVSIVPLAGLGFGLFYFLEGQIRSRALDGARNSAMLVARSSVEPLVLGADLRAPLPPRLQKDLTASARQLHGAGVVRIKLWNLDHKIVYSDKPQLIGRTFPASDEFIEAA